MAKVLPLEEKSLVARLLEIQAIEFFEGAKCIADVRNSTGGDSAYFLRLMAIELYFKLLYLNETDSLIFGHDLREIYDVMPSSCRESIFKNFNNNLLNQVISLEPLDLREFREWLKYLGELFTRIRYPFDEFSDMSIEEYEAKIRKFMSAAPDDFTDASIVYHNDRIKALFLALRARAGQ